MFESIFNFLFTGLLSVIGYAIIETVAGTLFYFVYNPIAPKWLYFIPQNLQTIGYFESIALFICVGLIGMLIKKLVPKLISK